MPFDPQDGGLDDWIAPARTQNISDGPDDWIAPATARRAPYPDDWITPAPSAASTAIEPAPGPPANSANPGGSNRPAARPDPLAAYWSRIPASRAGAMAWHPPIFLTSPGQFPLTTPAPLNAPWIDPMRSQFELLANLPSADPAAFPSFQPTGLASGDGDQPALRPLFSSLANLPWSPPPSASEGVSLAGDFSTGNDAGRGSLPSDGAFGVSLGPDPFVPSPAPPRPAPLAFPPTVSSEANLGLANPFTSPGAATATDPATPSSDQTSADSGENSHTGNGPDQTDLADSLDQTPDLETGSTPSQIHDAWSRVDRYLRANQPEIARIPIDIADMLHDAMTDFPEFLRRAEPSLTGLGLSAPMARAAGNVWLLNDMIRGRIAEVVHGRNVPFGFKTIDRFVDGIATSTKTIDLNARYYQTEKALYYKLRAYINKLVDFIGAPSEKFTIEEHEIAGRALDVLVPHSGTVVQKSAIERAIEYGARHGVKVNIIRHQ